MARMHFYTHEQELDRLELGDRPARCLKGENATPERDRIVAGRAHRVVLLRQRLEGHERFRQSYGQKVRFDEPWRSRRG